MTPPGNNVTLRTALFILIAFCQGLLSLPSEASRGCTQLTVAANGTITVRFSLPRRLANPPWNTDALAEYGFSLEKHGPLPYLPVRPVSVEIGSRAISIEVLESKLVEVPDVLRRASAARQPSIESEIVVAPSNGRPIPLSVFPESSFPRGHVIVEKPVIFGRRAILRAKIYPFARQDKRSAPTRADLLVFRITPLRPALAETVAPKAAKRPVAEKTGTARPLILSVPLDGIHAVEAEDLFPWWGEEPLSLESLSLTCRENDVPYHVVGDGDKLLEAGESVLFYGVGGDNIFTRDNAYWLVQNGQGMAMESVSRPPPAEGAVTHLPRRVRFEENHVLYEGQPPGTGEDHWFWAKITAPGTADAEIGLSNLADSPDFPAELRIGLQGATSSHTTRVSINGNTLVEEQWEGLVPNVVEAEFRQELLQEGTNVVAVEELTEGENPDIVYLDWIEVQYDSRSMLADGQLRLVVPPNTPGIIVSGLLTQDASAFDVTEGRSPCLVEGFTVIPADGTYQLHLGTMSDSPAEYVILSAGSAKRPGSIRQRSESRWSTAENAADWIVVGPSDFLDEARRLASHRESQGLRTTVVDIQDVYDEFNHGVTSPEAARNLVRFAYENWERPAPRYLLLFGDGHGDYMDWVGIHQPNFVLPHYSWVPPLGWAPDDDWFGCVEGDDAFPEVLVGRVPVRSPEEAHAVVEKIIAYDSTAVPQEWLRRVTFCASAGSLFQGMCHSLATAVPPNLQTSYLFRDDFPDAAAMNQSILESLHAGTFLLFYVGHGNIERWSENVLDVSDVPSLTNADKLPIMCMLTCLTGYFAVPWKECLAEELLRASNGGAAACIAPTGTGYPSEHSILGQGIMRRFFASDTIGQCLAEAKLDAYARGLNQSFLRGFGLIGDPAMAAQSVPSTPDLLWFY
jgi:hypothetical protein